MKNLPLAAMTILLPLMISSCGATKDKDSSAAAESNETEDIQVKTMTLKEETVSRNLEFTANLNPFEEIQFAPASPGRIEKIYVEVGSRVKVGDLIAQMDRTQLIQAMEQFKNAESSFQRMDTLFKLGSIPEQQYEAVKTQYELAKTNVDFLTTNTRLTSPINGIVTGKYFESGELYSGAPNTAAGKAAIVSLMQINPLKAVVHISESYYPEVKKGMATMLNVDIYPNKEFPGEISKIYPFISPETRSFQVEIKVNNPSEVLRPGMFARVSLNMGEKTVLVVPSHIVLRQEGTNRRHVFLVKEGYAKKIDVEITERFDNKIHIVSNELKEGDEIVIAGQEKLMDEIKVVVSN